MADELFPSVPMDPSFLEEQPKPTLDLADPQFTKIEPLPGGPDVIPTVPLDVETIREQIPEYIIPAETAQDKTRNHPHPEPFSIVTEDLDPGPPVTDPLRINANKGRTALDAVLSGTVDTLASLVETGNLVTGDTDGSDLAQRMRAVYAYDPELAKNDGFFMNTFLPGLGSTLPFFAAGATALIPGAPAAAAWLVPAFLGAAVGGGSGFRDALNHGATEDEALASWALNAPLGALEGLPVLMAFGRLNKITGGAASKNIGASLDKVFGGRGNLIAQVDKYSPFKQQGQFVLQSGIMGAIEEGLQETAQTIGGNVIAGSILNYDSTRTWNEHLKDAAAGGTSVGFTLSVLMSALGIKLKGVQTPSGALQKLVNEGTITEEDKTFFLQQADDIVNDTNLDLMRAAHEAAKNTVESEAGVTTAELAASLGIDINDVKLNALLEKTKGFNAANTQRLTSAEEFTHQLDREAHGAERETETVLEALVKGEEVIVSNRMNPWKGTLLTMTDTIDGPVPDTHETQTIKLQAKKTEETLEKAVAVLRELSPFLKDSDGNQAQIILTRTYDSSVDGRLAGVAGQLGKENTAGGHAILRLNLDGLEEETGHLAGDPDNKEIQRSVQRAQGRVLSTTFHEVGHLIARQKFGVLEGKIIKIGEMIDADERALAIEALKKTKDFKVYQGLKAEYLKWLWRMKDSDNAAALLTSMHPSSSNIERFDIMGDATATSLIGTKVLANKTNQLRNSDFFSFSEWVARSVARTADTGKGLPTEVDKYFGEIRELWTKYYKATKDKIPPAIRKDVGYGSVEKFLDYQVALTKLNETVKTLPGFQQATQGTPVEALQQNKGNLPPNDPKLTKKGFENFNVDQDKFNKFYAIATNILQIGRVNEHIEPLQKYINLTKDWANARANRAFRTEQVHTRWRKLKKARVNKLTKILQDERDNGEFFNEEELLKRGMDEDMMAVREDIITDFRDILSSMENVLVQNAIRKNPDDIGKQTEEVDKLRKQFNALRDKPYFPRMRFGRFGVQVVDTQGNQISYKSFEKERHQRKEIEEQRNAIRRNPAKRAGQKVLKKEFGDFEQSIQAFPGNFAELVIDRLDELSKEDAFMALSKDQKKAITDLAHETNEAKGFLKRFLQSRNVPGFSTDGLRVYASYMSSATNFIARLEFAPQLMEQIRLLQKQDSFIKKNSPDQGQASDQSKRGEIAIWLQDHLRYIMTPQNEWAGLRSGVFTWFLGFNVKSALLNSTQIMYTTVPYLSARFGGVGKAGGAIVSAMNYQTQKKFTKNELDENNEKFLQNGIKDGFLDEGLSTSLAVDTRSDRLDRALPDQKAKLLLSKVPHYSAWMFHSVEKMNRNVTGLAAFNLALDKGMSFEEAYQEGRNAVERTQFEYARWNRPKFMRGKKSIIFVFQNYVQNMLWFSIKEQGAMRYWFIQAILAGAMGLPGADDLMDLVDGVWPRVRKFFGLKGPFKSARVEMRKVANSMVEDLNINPDWLLHGVSRRTFGLGAQPIVDRFPIPRIDLSGSLGMGNIIPATDAVRAVRRGELDSFLARGSADVAGATGSSVYNVLRAIFDNDPDQWKRWERALPAAMRNMSKAGRLYVRGEEKTRSGNVIAEFDPFDRNDKADLMALALGFQPTKLTEGWEKQIAQMEVVEYYRKQKAALLGDFNFARSGEGDREAVADVQKAIKQYNDTVPFPAMKIGTDTLRRSLSSRRRIEARGKNDLALQNEYIILRRQVGEVFDEPENDEGI